MLSESSWQFVTDCKAQKNNCGDPSPRQVAAQDDWRIRFPDLGLVRARQSLFEDENGGVSPQVGEKSHFGALSGGRGSKWDFAQDL